MELDNINPDLLQLPEIYMQPELKQDVHGKFEGYDDLGKPQESDEVGQSTGQFYENLALILPKSKLNRIAAQLKDDIERDKNSRKDWEKGKKFGLKQLGYKPQKNRKAGYAEIFNVYDTTMSQAFLHALATAMAELFPRSGPASCGTPGFNTPQKEMAKQTRADFLNFYLTILDKDYYEDSYHHIGETIMGGFGPRKVYMDPITGYPVARGVCADDLIIDPEATSFRTASRITQRYTLTKKEIFLRQKSKVFKEFKISDTKDSMDDLSDLKRAIENIKGISTEGIEKKNSFEFYESHTDLLIEGFDEEYSEGKIPLPYIVTINNNTDEIVALVRNWEEGDPTFKRIECWVLWNYIKAMFKIYGIGITHLIGSNSNVLTAIIRELTAAASYRNYPAFMMKEGVRNSQPIQMAPPGGAVKIPASAGPISEYAVPLPYHEPSSGYFEIYKTMSDKTMGVAAVTQAPVERNRADANVGTVMAIMKEESRVPSMVLQGMIDSLSEELRLIDKLFKIHFKDRPFTFNFNGQTKTITISDFTSEIDVFAKADPKLTTAAERIVMNDAILKTASTAPQMHNMYEVYRRYYEGMGVDEIEKILTPPQDAQPLDPITENMNAMQGKPLKAALWQDHPAHITTHMLQADQPGMQAHIQEHNAMQYFLDMQNAMQIQLPTDPQAMMQPDVQNQIALAASRVTVPMLEAQKQQAEAQQPVSPNKLLEADIHQKEVQSQLKAQEVAARIEAEKEKMYLNHQTEMAKIEAQRNIAVDKNLTSLTLEQMKHENEFNKLPPMIR